MDPIPQIGRLTGLEELARADGPRPRDGVSDFADTLKEAVLAVDELQKDSESAQLAFARNEDVDLHDVLIKVEEAEIAFKAMMEIRNKLVDAYKEIMRMGS
jgi:flagellar hook-basal body complex protein FliE